MPEEFGLLGAGAQADEVESFAAPAQPRFRAVQSDYLGSGSEGLIDIAAPPAEFLTLPVIGAVGGPGLRRELIEAWPGDNYRTVVSSGAWVDPSSRIGAGTMIAPGAVVSVNTSIGDHVLINVSATVSHDTVVGEYSTISPGVHIAGRCVIGAGVFIGIGAIVSDNVSIPRGTVIGAGSLVLRSIETPGVYVGSPASQIDSVGGWLRTL